jgi:hypothetical protein
LSGIALPQCLVQIVAAGEVIEPGGRKTAVWAQSLCMRKTEGQGKKKQVETREHDHIDNATRILSPPEIEVGFDGARKGWV